MQMKEKTRLWYMDNIKLLLIFLVVVGHALNLNVYSSKYIKLLYVWIYSFHMPLFIFIAGYFSKNAEKCRNDAVEKYFFPYVVLVVLSFLHIKCTVSDEETIAVFRLFSPASSCWYLFALFVWKLLINDLKKIKNVYVIALLIGLLAGFSHEFGHKLSLSRILVFTFFFVWGYKTDEKRLEKIREMPKWFYIVLIAIATCAIYYLSVVKKLPIEAVLVRRHYRDEALMQDCIYRLIFYVLGSTFIISIIGLIPNKKFKVTYIGERTYMIYYFHMFLVRVLDEHCSNVQVFRDNPAIYVVFIVVISLIIIYLLSRKIVEKMYDMVMDKLWGLFMKE